MNYHDIIPVFQSKENDGYHTDQDPQTSGYSPKVDVSRYDSQADASGHVPQVDASGHPGSFGYTALPSGMACDLQESLPGYTQQDTVVVTQPRVKTSLEQPVPRSTLGISLFSSICCVWPLCELKIGLISSN